MFSGEFIHNIDSKGRVIIPARFRDALGDTFVITKGFENCLSVYTNDEWEKVAQKLGELPSNQKNARRIQRIFLSGACPCEADKQGRFLIPPTLRTHANLDKEVVIIGDYNKLEIWDINTWNSYINDENELSPEEAAESLDGISF